MDNSPLWDDALERMSSDAASIADVRARRRARSPTRPSGRPMREYDRYVYLVSAVPRARVRARADPRRSRRSRSNRSSSTRSSCSRTRTSPRSRGSLGADPEPFEDVGREHGHRPRETLWDEEQALYVDYDVIAETPVSVGTAAGLAPLYAGVPTASGPSAWSNDSRTPACRSDGSGWAVTSLSPGRSGFQPTRYWRGPVWPILNWVLQRGLERYGYRDRCRAGSARGRRARPERGVLGALQPAHRDGVTAASSSPGPPHSFSTCSTTDGSTARARGDGTLTSTAFLVTPA